MMKFEGLAAEKTGLHLVCIFAAIFLVFGNSLFFDFVWDDRIYLLGQEVYEDFRLKDILFSPANGVEYLPVRDISYALDFLVWGRNPTGFHLSNLVLYMLNALFVYFATLELTSLFMKGAQGKLDASPRAVAFFTTLLFAVHPVHSEVVSFITCRNVLLSGLFFFMSFYCFLRYAGGETGSGRGYYALSFFCFVLALFSKATSIILPLVLLLAVLFIKRVRPGTMRALSAFFLVSGAAFFLFEHIARKTGTILDYAVKYGSFSMLSKFAVSVQIPFFYLMKLFVPSGFSAEYADMFSRDPADAAVVLSVLALVVLACIGVMTKRRRPEIIFSFLWFMAALLPVMNFFMTNPVVADRYVYLPSYAFFFLAAVFLLRTAHVLRWRWIIIFIAVIAASWSFIAAGRNSVWKTERTLWEDAIRSSPGSRKAYENLGSIYFNNGEYEKAFDLFGRLKKRDPSSVTLDYYRGLQLFNEGDFRGTIEVLRKSMVENRESLRAIYLLARSYDAAGNVEDAIESYLNVLNSNELDREGYREFAGERLERLRTSIRPELDMMRRRVKENSSDLNARARLAVVLDRAGLYDEAVEQYKELERRGGDNYMLFYNMANMYKKIDEYEKAALYYRKSLAMKGDNADAYNNLGAVLKKLERYEQAIEAYRNAINADRNFAYAPFNLALLYFHAGDKGNALKYFNYVQERFPDLRDRAATYKSMMDEGRQER